MEHNLRTMLSEELNTSSFSFLIPKPSMLGDYLKSTFGSNPKVQVEMIPHPLKQAKGGEDAFFVSTNDRGFAIGIADGVGGWGHQGIDPSLVSKGLMLGAKQAFENGVIDPVELMDSGYKQVKHITGSSTALVLVITEGGTKLTAANLGDSGFMVLRDGKVLFRSEEMQHFFNFPFQLGTGHSTTAYDSQVITLDLREGDIVIAGSDALFDNLFDEDIVKIVHETLPHECLAQRLANAAFHRGYSNKPSPFMSMAYKLGLVDSEEGGKPDDITVVVTRISPTKESE